MFVAMTIHDASRALLFQLLHLYEESEAANIADWVMEFVTGWKKVDRVFNKTVPLSGQQQQLLEQLTKQLLEHTPVQYVLHEAWFYKMKLYVDENVLIPRPETEELVQWIITDQVNNSTVSILDIGTGSGCIPIALKKELPAAQVHACDISTAALEVANRNASEQHTSIQFHQLNFLSGAERRSLPSFNIIVSNPPYIPQKDKAAMSKVVLDYEPHLALFVDDDNALVFYEAIADFSCEHLHRQGSVYMEIHESLGKEVLQLFSEKGFTNISLRKDMQGKDRMVKLRW